MTGYHYRPSKDKEWDKIDVVLLLRQFVLFVIQKEEPGPTVVPNRAAGDKKLWIVPEYQKAGEPKAVKNLSLEVEPGVDCHVEYTELALDCLDLKAQEELLSPPLTGNNNISLTDPAKMT